MKPTAEQLKDPNHPVDATDMVTGQKFDQGKPMMGLIPPRAEMAVAEVLTFGANKYGPDNWRHVEDLELRYTDAALRHINSHRQQQANDQESGMPHLAHAICCLMFMLELECWRRDFENGELKDEHPC